MKDTIKIAGLGYCGMDYLCIVPRIPLDDKVEIIQNLVQGGGPAATAVVTASRLGAETAFFGAIGDDERGTQIVKAFEKEGVVVSGMKISQGAESPAAYSWVDNTSGKRSIAWTHGGAEPLSANDITPDQLKGVDVLHLDGHQIEAAIAAAEIAHGCGTLVSLDAGTPVPGIDTLMELSDIVIASGKFAVAYTGGSCARDSVKKLFFGSRKFAGVTVGKKGSVGFDGESLLECPHFDVDKVVDTTGAGDVFHGAFAVAVAHGKSWKECMRFATITAALKCTALGGRTAIPDFETVEKLWIKNSEAITKR